MNEDRKNQKNIYRKKSQTKDILTFVEYVAVCFPFNINYSMKTVLFSVCFNWTNDQNTRAKKTHYQKTFFLFISFLTFDFLVHFGNQFVSFFLTFIYLLKKVLPE